MSELEALPEGWLKLPLREVVQTQKGKKPFNLGERNSERTVPYINIKAFEKKIIFEYAPEQDIPLCETQDVLLVWDGARAGLSGRGVRGYIGSTLARIRSDLVDPAYLYYFMDSIYGYLNTQTKGVGIPHVNPDILFNISFSLPPEKEQARIVEKLEELLSDLDSGVAELKAAQIKLTQYRQSLLKSAVEGSLTAEWRAKNQPSETGQQLLQRILTERRQRWEQQKRDEFKQKNQKPPKDWQLNYPEPVKPDISELPELPEGWVWASAAQLGLVQLGRQRTPSKMHGANPTLYIRAANITEAGIDFSDVLKMDFTEKEIPIYRLHPGDVLLTEASGSPEHVGRPCIWPETNDLYCFQNTVIRFAPVGVKPEFCFELFHAYQKLGKYIDVAAGVGINHLSAGKFSRIAFPLPSANEQDALVRIINTEKSLILRKLETIKATLKQSEAQRKNILKEAFSGKLVPQDPSDEPASVLLEKIKAERALSAAQKKPRQLKKKPNSMKNFDLDRLKEWVADFDGDRFTFAKIASDVGADYESLKNIIFLALSEPTPVIHQYFDEGTEQMVFKKASP